MCQAGSHEQFGIRTQGQSVGPDVRKFNESSCGGDELVNWRFRTVGDLTNRLGRGIESFREMRRAYCVENKQ